MTKQPEWGHARATFNWTNGHTQESDVCIISFTIPNDIEPPILFYYRLTNFYQNHRRYVKSFDINQLKGDAVSTNSIKSGECDPLTVAPGRNGGSERPYYPCGLIANSMFNDTFMNITASNAQGGGEQNRPYNMYKKGIAWSSDGDLYGKTQYKPGQVVPPPNWAEQFPESGYDNLTELPDLHTMEDFHVWMRTAGLPTFSKLAMRNNDETLQSGTYRLQIFDRMTLYSLLLCLAKFELGFPVHKYGGTKSILISTRTVVGGKNPFLGIAYVVVGGLCILLGTVFTLTHLVKPR
jgi:hypothetical protein